MQYFTYFFCDLCNFSNWLGTVYKNMCKYIDKNKYWYRCIYLQLRSQVHIASIKSTSIQRMSVQAHQPIPIDC